MKTCIVATDRNGNTEVKDELLRTTGRSVADMDDDEYEAMLEARENAESMYWDTKIDEARGN